MLEGVDERPAIGLTKGKSICTPPQEEAACGLNYASELFGFAFKSENCSYYSPGIDWRGAAQVRTSAFVCPRAGGRVEGRAPHPWGALARVMGERAEGWRLAGGSAAGLPNAFES